MQEKVPLIVSFIFILLGLIKFDIGIYPTLDYFGKFVMVLSLNIMPFWISMMINERFENTKRVLFVILWGFLAGVFFYKIAL